MANTQSARLAPFFTPNVSLNFLVSFPKNRELVLEAPSCPDFAPALWLISHALWQDGIERTENHGLKAHYSFERDRIGVPTECEFGTDSVC